MAELPELTEEQEAESHAAFRRSHARRSFIQDAFESQLKRKLEEEEAKQAAGLKGFKATGNAMQDAFRRMIEKKMKEKVEAELVRKNEEEAEVLRQQMEMR